MRPGARLRAAIEILDDILNRHRPAASALADWGKNHRFAGSGDRAAIGNLVYDVLRRKRSLAARMGGDSPRQLVLAAAPRALALSPAAVAASADGSPYSIEALTASEIEGLSRELPEDAPSGVRGDFPDWLAPSLERVFGPSAAAEGAALARRAPIDLRVNTLKAERDKVLRALQRFAAGPTPFSPVGVRLPPAEGPARAPHVEAEPGHGKGWYEIQDEGSQIAALMAGAEPRKQVLDICAGAGGKTLAMAAMMRNTGQIYAYDQEPIRLRPIFERLKRAGVRNTQVLPAGQQGLLQALGPRFDVVLVDAPCSGTGAWRRRPDAKWRLKPESVADRQREQRHVLALGAELVKPGGRLLYVTCSILPEENSDQVFWFLQNHDAFTLLPWRQVWRSALGSEPPASADGREDCLLLTPARHATDGFFVAALARRS
jgi:16S rRNA (cytosine967-C5)-methyltransferase